MEHKYDIEEYTTEDGKSPFSDWVSGVKDKTVARKIARRIDRATLGNFGDCKSIQGAKGIFEMREHYGPGYRILYSIVENKVVLLLAGSIKRDQAKAITAAKQYLADYERRKTL